MLNAYLNYPNSLVTVHGEPTCSTIRQMRKSGQRHVRVNTASRAREREKFDGTYRFGSKAEVNDMWVVVDLESPEEEARMVEEIKSALGRRYKPFRDARIERHC